MPVRPKNPEILSLTGIRAIAAWWVVFYHLKAIFITGSARFDHWIQGALGTGYLGVDLFFALSGFVIAYNYWDRFEAFDLRRYRQFLWLRLARMYPVHLATLFLALGLYASARWKGVALHFGSSWTAGQFVQNLFLVHNWSLHPVLSWNFPSWSISCEWLAYLLFPLLVHILGSRRSPLVLGALMFGGLLLLSGAFQFQHWGPVAAGVPRIAVNFFAGVVIFQIHRKWSTASWSSWLVNGTLVVAIAFLILSFVWPGITPFWMTLVFPVLLYGLACGHGIIAKILATRPAVFWGRASYSLYMTHGLVIMALSKIAPLSNSYSGVRSMAAHCAVYFGTAALVAVASYFLIEEPGRGWMKRRQRRANPRPEPAHHSSHAAGDGLAAELQHASR